MKAIKPVLRYPGSKYRKVDKIIEILSLKKEDVFLDMFGGSGVVGVNVKHKTNCEVYINDYDKVLPITINTAIKNMLSFQGLGKNFTKQALEYFNTRIENGYWTKLKGYNNVLEKCEIIGFDWTKVKHLVQTQNIGFFSKIYSDPPYHDIKGLYKNSFNDEDHIAIKNQLDVLKDTSKILISYNDTPFIRELYKDWFISEEEFQYQTGKLNPNGKKPKVKELFITNFKIIANSDSKEKYEN